MWRDMFLWVWAILVVLIWAATGSDSGLEQKEEKNGKLTFLLLLIINL